jgi:hypothetical protein
MSNPNSFRSTGDGLIIEDPQTSLTESSYAVRTNAVHLAAEDEGDHQSIASSGEEEDETRFRDQSLMSSTSSNNNSAILPQHHNLLTQSEPNLQLSSSNNVPPSTTSQARRRRGQPPSQHQQYLSTVPSSTSNANSTLLFVNETIDEEGEEDGNGGSLRSSLDAGMAAVRRWIRSRSSANDDNTTQHDPSETEEFLTMSQPQIFLSDRNSPAVFEGGTDYRNSDDDCDNYYDCDMDRQQRSARQRALSEPDALRIRDFLFQRALNHNTPQSQRGSFRRRRQHSSRLSSRRRSQSESIELMPSSQLSSSAAEALYTSSRSTRSSTDDTTPDEIDLMDIVTLEPSTIPEDSSVLPGGVMETAPQRQTAIDSTDTFNNNDGGGERNDDENSHSVDEARARWIAINRRFQMIITVVAIMFSLLLFAILVCWVVLTSAYVVSIDKSCDVPLKVRVICHFRLGHVSMCFIGFLLSALFVHARLPCIYYFSLQAYFWMVTLQLILDVFRADIMRLFFNWDSGSANRRIPLRIILYNIAYLTYAILVLRTGINSVFVEEGTTCHRTAPELFQSSTAFVTLTIAAWATIILGYLVPFLFVATLLTWNGYTPSSDAHPQGAPGPFSVFPGSMGAPPGCVDRLRVAVLEEFPADYPLECCICMENFVGSEAIVETECNHVFHKSCCREWLRQARTCPVCRMDIPEALEQAGNESQTPTTSRGPRLGFGPTGRSLQRDGFHQEMVGLLRILRRRDRRRLHRAIAAGSAAAANSSPQNRSNAVDNGPGTVADIPPASQNVDSLLADLEQG